MRGTADIDRLEIAGRRIDRGKENASNSEWAIVIVLASVVSAVTLAIGGRGGLSMKAAAYGTVAGILFGLSSSLTKPTLEFLHQSVGAMLSHWECYALAVAGVLGFVLQQVSLGTGKLAPSVATVSVANPLVSILIGVLLFDERFSRPGWHIVLAVGGLSLALVGAAVISLAREAGKGDILPHWRLRRVCRDRLSGLLPFPVIRASSVCVLFDAFLTRS